MKYILFLNISLLIFYTFVIGPVLYIFKDQYKCCILFNSVIMYTVVSLLVITAFLYIRHTWSNNKLNILEKFYWTFAIMFTNIFAAWKYHNRFIEELLK